MSEDNSLGFEMDGTRRWGPLPDDLREYDQWVVSSDKNPVYPSTGWQKKQNQLSFGEARKEAIIQNAELEFILNGSDPFAVIDLDDVGKPADHNREVMRIIEGFPTYTEVSSSGSGVHIVCRGERLPGYKHEGPLNQRGSIEVYDSNQPIVLTADQLGEHSTVTEGGQFFQELQQEYLPEDDDTDTSVPGADKSRLNISNETQSEADGRESGPTVDQIKRTIDAWAANGSVEARRAKELWESSGARTYKSPSEADMAFASDLAFWCREDSQLMYRCIRRSDRHRQKWEEPHRSDRSTYAEMTIEKAIDTNIDQFTGRYVQ
jgi:putative DNA primase/helicase